MRGALRSFVTVFLSFPLVKPSMDPNNAPLSPALGLASTLATGDGGGGADEVEEEEEGFEDFVFPLVAAEGVVEGVVGGLVSLVVG